MDIRVFNTQENRAFYYDADKTVLIALPSKKGEERRLDWEGVKNDKEHWYSLTLEKVKIGESIYTKDKKEYIGYRSE